MGTTTGTLSLNSARCPRSIKTIHYDLIPLLQQVDAAGTQILSTGSHIYVHCSDSTIEWLLLYAGVQSSRLEESFRGYSDINLVV